jgi:SAM-dependent methyltransferase
VGFDRGQPIDRYYIEKFLFAHVGDICGRVREFGDNPCTRRFGGDRVRTLDVWDYPDKTEGTTLLVDSASAPEVPSELFDCVISTQTPQCVLDTRAAIRTLYRVLRPGGVLLATVPGLTHVRRCLGRALVLEFHECFGARAVRRSVRR